MNVVVMNRGDAKAYSYAPHTESSVIISITDPDRETNHFNEDAKNNIKSILRLQFFDVDSPDPGTITEDDAKRIADFAFYWKDKVDTIIVHCEAGQSRSAGAAAAILKAFTGHDEQIFDNPKYTPNRTVYRSVLTCLMDFFI